MRKSCCIWLADTWPGLVEAVCVKDWFCFVAVPPTGEFCWPSVTFPCSLMLHLSHQTMTKMSPLLVWGLRRCCRALEGRNKNQKRQLGGLAGGPMLPAAELQDWMGAAPSSLVKAWPSQCTLVVFWKHQGLQAKRDVLETWHTGACIQSCKSLCCLCLHLQRFGDAQECQAFMHSFMFLQHLLLHAVLPLLSFQACLTTNTFWLTSSFFHLYSLFNTDAHPAIHPQVRSNPSHASFPAGLLTAHAPPAWSVGLHDGLILSSF